MGATKRLRLGAWAACERSPAFDRLPAFPHALPGHPYPLSYWDSYWVLKGLLASNLTELAEGCAARCGAAAAHCLDV